MTFLTENVNDYAASSLEVKLFNPSPRPQEVNFTFVIPNGGMITNFSMVLDGKEVAAVHMDKTNAEAFYRSQTNTSKTVAVLSVEFSHEQLVRLKIFMAGHDLVELKVSYEEYIPKRDGAHTQEVKFFSNLCPDTLEAVLLFPGDQKMKLNCESEECSEPLSGVVKGKKRYDATCKPRLIKQVEGSDLKAIRFSYNRLENGSSFTSFTDDYFAFFLTPDLFLNRFRKHVVFVLDVSGSMAGERLDLTKAAMRSLLGTLTDNDHFNIITFHSSVHFWKQNSVIASIENRKAAEDYVKGLRVLGGTNIGAALKEALVVARNFYQNVPPSSEELVQIVFFMTDGGANEGLTSKSDIVNMIIRENTSRVKIHGMALGQGADVGLVEAVSGCTGGRSIR